MSLSETLLASNATTETPPPIVEFPSWQMGLGTMRTTGNIICLLLHTEEITDRASIIAWAAKTMKIPLTEIAHEYNNAP